ncbi:glycosyltransferase family 9 protein [bacterium]|nr:glycosyltransferase family 9 protein [bacterium]
MKTRFGKGEPRTILVTRLRFLGDVVLTLPVVSALRRAYPGAAIDYLCEAPYHEVLDRVPELRAVHALRRGDGATGEGAWELVRRLRGRYDLVLDLFGNPRSAWLTWLTGAPTRVGRGRFPRSLLYNVRPPEDLPDDSAPRHHLRFVESIAGPQALTAPRLTVSPAELSAGRRMLEDRGLGGNTVAILTGATQPTKEWPEERFVGLAAQLRMDGRYRPVFLGQPGKRRRLERIRALSNSKVVILPELELRPLMGLLAACRALVAGDGGIMHLAIALGVPTLALFGPTDPNIWFPYDDQPHAELLTMPAHCRPCHKHVCDDPFCLADLGVDFAFERLVALLEGR